jgi:predicted nucleic acid-binding protein
LISPVHGARLFLDTYYVQALLNPRDPHHARALAFLPQVRRAAEVVITEAVFAEVGNALSGTPRLRQLAAAFIRRCYAEANMAVVSVDTALMTRALELFESRADKDWGLTDCISFVVMREHDLTEAATGDRHFQQAGFRALMLGPES